MTRNLKDVVTAPSPKSVEEVRQLLGSANSQTVRLAYDIAVRLDGHPVLSSLGMYDPPVGYSLAKLVENTLALVVECGECDACQDNIRGWWNAVRVASLIISGIENITLDFNRARILVFQGETVIGDLDVCDASDLVEQAVRMWTPKLSEWVERTDREMAAAEAQEERLRKMMANAHLN